MTTLNTIIEEEKKKARDWFTSEYCVKRPAQGIRWIRSIFFDDYDQITKILESHDKAITTAMQRAYEAGRQNTVEEIEKYILSEHIHYSKEHDWQFKEEEPYIQSMDFERWLNTLLLED